MKFAQIAGVVAASLKRQEYIPTTDPKTANLLIFVYWGQTIGSEEGGGTANNLGPSYAAMARAPDLGPGANGVNGVDAQRISNDISGLQFDMSLDRAMFENEIRDRTNAFNASLLGYEKARNETNFLRPYSITARDILSEVEESRYFVVLKAYDFQRLREHKGKRLLWELRYSIRRAGNRFDEQLVDMTRYATQFTGQNLDRLVRRHIANGHVEVGTPVVVPDHTK